jgi:hypothetical protein
MQFFNRLRQKSWTKYMVSKHVRDRPLAAPIRGHIGSLVEAPGIGDTVGKDPLISD